MIRILAVGLMLLGGCARNDNLAVVNGHEDFSCRSPGIEKIIPWGESGAARVCEIRSGSFIAAEGNKLVLIGQYSDGKEVGVWRWYDKKGNVAKEIDYSIEQPK